MARPKMTEAQKADAKRDREAAKADAIAGAAGKADKAEARAGAKLGGAASAATKPSPSANTDDFDREEKALFFVHLPNIKRLRALLLTANSNLRGAYKKALAEGGFTKTDFDTAIAVETAESEARERARITRSLKIAKIMGSDLGAQLDMFLEPVRTPAVENAFAEGERDAMQNIAARPKYDPSTEQARKYLEGYHSVSAKRVMKGIGKLDPEAGAMADQDANAKAKNDQQRAQDDKVFEQSGKPNGEPVKASGESDKPGEPAAAVPPASGVAMTRAQFKAQEDARKVAGKPN